MKYRRVMSIKRKVTLSPTQLRMAFERLPKTDKLRLVEVFERATWADRFDRLVRRIRRRARRYPPITDAHITRVCREVRQDLYDLTQRRRGR